MVEKKKEQTGWRPLVAGGIAGVVDSTITMPLDTLKTQMQLTKQHSVMTCVRNVMQASGFRGFYAGFVPFTIEASGKASVRFFSYYTLCSIFDSLGFDRTKNAAMWSFGCGTFAGMIEALVWTTPAERMKILEQAEAAKATKSHVSVKHILETQGIKGLYVGAVPTAIRQASSVAVRFTIAEQIKHDLTAAVKRPDGTQMLPPALVSFLGGGLGGAVSVVVNNPIDVVKSKIQAGYKGGIVACMKDIYQTRGLLAFGSGLSLRVPRLFMSQAIQFMMVDQVLIWLNNVVPPKK
eukprot:c19609_g1_i2.p1 GENE.c19609_g1_i2~~c19609_g1_i2.p1  ORF type:complete len:293 (+),score=136.09 c19609_g1_i2:55-933(+)